MHVLVGIAIVRQLKRLLKCLCKWRKMKGNSKKLFLSVKLVHRDIFYEALLTLSLLTLKDLETSGLMDITGYCPNRFLFSRKENYRWLHARIPRSPFWSTVMSWYTSINCFDNKTVCKEDKLWLIFQGFFHSMKCRCGYSLEWLRWGNSKEYPKHTFWLSANNIRLNADLRKNASEMFRPFLSIALCSYFKLRKVPLYSYWNLIWYIFCHFIIFVSKGDNFCEFLFAFIYSKSRL